MYQCNQFFLTTPAGYAQKIRALLNSTHGESKLNWQVPTHLAAQEAGCEALKFLDRMYELLLSQDHTARLLRFQALDDGGQNSKSLEFFCRLRNGSRIGFHADSVLELALQIAALWRESPDESNWKTLCRLVSDIRTKDLRMAWLLDLIEQHVFKGYAFEAAEMIRLTRDRATVMDGMHLIAQKAYFPNFQFAKAEKLYSEEYEAGSLSASGMLKYAEVLAALNKMDTAECIVAKAYALDESLNDGYAKIGFMRFVRREYDANAAIEYFQKDLENSLIGTHLKVLYAGVLAGLGQIREAEHLIKQAYSEIPDGKLSGYALVGWYGYWLRKRDAHAALELIEKDLISNRLAPSWMAKVDWMRELLTGKTVPSACWRQFEGKCDLHTQIIQDIYRWIQDQNEQELLQTLIASFESAQNNILANTLLLAFMDFFGAGDADLRKKVLHNVKGELAYSIPFCRSWLERAVGLGKSIIDELLENICFIVDYPELSMVDDSPAELMRSAEKAVKNGHAPEAWLAIACAYQKEDSLHDAFAKAGWQIHWSRGNYREVIRWLEADNKHERLTASWKINLGMAYAATGNQAAADALVEQSYAENENVVNGYALVGWQGFWHRRDYTQASEYICRDLSLGRLRQECFRDYALTFLEMDALNEAASILMAGYSRHESSPSPINDLKGRESATNCNATTALKWLEDDALAGRLSPLGMLKLVKLLARQTALDDSALMLRQRCEELVSSAYKQDASLLDGYCIMAKYFAMIEPHHDIIAMYRKDLSMGRMSQFSLNDYVRYVCMTMGHKAAAGEIFRVYDIYPDWKDAHTVLAAELVKQGEYDLALKYCELDFNAGRMTPTGAVKFVELLIRTGDLNRTSQVLSSCLSRPDGLKAQALALARHLAPDATWPDMAVRHPGCYDPAESVRLLAAMSPETPAEQCIAFAGHYYSRRANQRDCLSCGARSVLAVGKTQKAMELFEADRSMGRANADSLLQYAEMLTDKDEAGTIREEALAMYNFPAEPWLAENRDRHKGGRCFVVGTGPSMRYVDCGLLAGEAVFAVNGAIFLDKLETTYFVSVSDMFWRHHARAIRELKCRRFLPYWMRGPLTSDSPTSWMNAPMPRFADMADQPMGNPIHFSRRADQFVALGGSVMFACLQLAWHLGFQEVIFLGLDHNYGVSPNGIYGGVILRSDQFTPAHFMQNYFKGGFFHLDLFAMERAYKLGLDHFEADGRRISNATPGTKLATYPKVKLEDVLKGNPQ